MRAAQAVTDAAFAHIVAFMRPGMTEREVQIELEDFMRRHGAEGLAFPSIVATGANGASPHAIPGATRCSRRVSASCSTSAPRAQRLLLGHDAHRVPGRARRSACAPPTRRSGSANEQVEAALRPGVTGKDMHELAERVLADDGFAGKMGHSLGHGVGHRHPRAAQPLAAQPRPARSRATWSRWSRAST